MSGLFLPTFAGALVFVFLLSRPAAHVLGSLSPSIRALVANGFAAAMGLLIHLVGGRVLDSAVPAYIVAAILWMLADAFWEQRRNASAVPDDQEAPSPVEDRKEEPTIPVEAETHAQIVAEANDATEVESQVDIAAMHAHLEDVDADAPTHEIPQGVLAEAYALDPKNKASASPVALRTSYRPVAADELMPITHPCTRCEEPNPPDARFCKKCSAPFGPWDCDGCGWINEKDAHFCVHCRKSLNLLELPSEP